MGNIVYYAYRYVIKLIAIACIYHVIKQILDTKTEKLVLFTFIFRDNITFDLMASHFQGQYDFGIMPCRLLDIPGRLDRNAGLNARRTASSEGEKHYT